MIRRAFHYAQFVAALALPAWLLVGWSIFGGGGLQLIGLLIVCPILAIAMLAVSAIISVRKEVRATRALSWLDAGILALWYLAIALAGTFGPATGLLEFAVVLIGLGAFWLVVWELIAETRKRISSVLAEFESQAGNIQAGHIDVQPSQTGPGFDPRKPQSGQTIRLE